MHDQGSVRYRMLLLIAGTCVAIWGVVGLVQSTQSGWSGYAASWDAVVTHVEESSPAAVSGLEAGDRIVSVDGTPIESLWTRPSLRDVEVGGTRLLGVERGGERSSVEIVWVSPPRDAVRANILDGVLALAFVGFCLWPLASTQASGALVLAIFGVSFGVTNLKGPYFGLPECVVEFARSNLSLFYTALLFHFLMIFPRPKGVFRRRVNVCVAYVPFLVFFIFGLARGFLYPTTPPGYAVVGPVTDLLYMCLALAALIHSCFSGTRSERRDSGIYLIPLGLAVAIVPFIVLAVVQMAVPEFVLPGHEYLPLLGIAIPCTMGWAVVKSSGSSITHSTAG
ncbi:MAG: PDZ domain-containing protein [Phycisphaerales bacterium]|nr:MAG: PDZ domain-containing protein [Phycisphaerales bacterium]